MMYKKYTTVKSLALLTLGLFVILAAPPRLEAAPPYTCWNKVAVEGPAWSLLMCYSPGVITPYEDLCDACYCRGSYVTEMRPTAYNNVGTLPSGYLDCTTGGGASTAPSTPVISYGGYDTATAGGHYYRAGFPLAFLSVLSTDPDSGNSISFQIDWDGNGTVDKTVPLVARHPTTGNVVYSFIPDSYPTVGNYSLKVRAVDNTGAQSAWSSIWNITIYTDPNLYNCNYEVYDEGPYQGSVALQWCAVTTGPGGSCFSSAYMSSYTPTYTNTSMTIPIVNAGYIVCGGSVAPQVPTISGTTNVATNVSTSNFVTTIEYDNQNVMFDIDWDGNGTVDGTTGYFAQGTSVPISRIYATPGTYTVKARARDSQGSVSGWSAPFTITVSTTSYNCEAGTFNPALGILTSNGTSIIGFLLGTATRVYHNVFGGNCFSNTSGINYFVPTKTVTELNSFLGNLPAGVTKANGGW